MKSLSQWWHEAGDLQCGKQFSAGENALARLHPNPGHEDPARGKFSLVPSRKTGWVDILYKFSEQRYLQAEELADPDELAESGIDIRQRTPVTLLKANSDKDVLIMFPRMTFPGDDFLQQKYPKINAIALEGFDMGSPTDEAEVEYMLETLPSGFLKDPEYGLGLAKNYRFIISAVEQIPGIRRLWISKTRKSEIRRNTYVLNFSVYNAIRKAINNTHTNALKIAAAEKKILVHNSMLYVIDKTKYSEQKRSYAAGTIYKAVEGDATGQLSDKDQLAAITLVGRSKDRLAKNHPETLLRLQREIEVVTLQQLIERMESRIKGKVTEPNWQKFFLENPFVLSLAFGLPLVVIGDQISVGGRTFFGGGEKISDFLAKNLLTDNLALIEIKTAYTKLIGREYRGGVYPGSRELAGCVTQVLDQRHKIQAELNALKANSEQYNMQAYAIRCVIIIGTTPKHSAEKKSFELFRNNLHDILVITFDELLEKLRHLHRFLSTDIGARKNLGQT